MTHTDRHAGYASSLSTLLVICLGLLLGGCASKPGLLSDRGGLVPPPYETPAPSSGRAGMLSMPSPQSAFPAVLPTVGAFAEGPAALVEDSPVAKADPAPASEIVLPEAPVTAPLTHTVGKGESLWLIAQQYGITYQELAGINHLDPKAVLKVGQMLTIPPGGRPGAASENRAPTVRGAKTAKTAKTAKKPSSAPAQVAGGEVSTYVVQNGDCLSKIAARSGTTSADLRQLNNLKSDTIFIGQKLQVRGEVKGAAPAAAKTDEPKKADVPTVEPKEAGTLPEVAPTGDAPAVDIPAAPAVEGAAVVPGEVAPAPVAPDVAAPAPAGEGVLRKLPHDVCKDDTLENIAEMYGTTVQAILQANPEVKSNTDLVIGKTIMVPYK